MATKMEYYKDKQPHTHILILYIVFTIKPQLLLSRNNIRYFIFIIIIFPKYLNIKIHINMKIPPKFTNKNYQFDSIFKAQESKSISIINGNKITYNTCFFSPISLKVEQRVIVHGKCEFKSHINCF